MTDSLLESLPDELIINVLGHLNSMYLPSFLAVSRRLKKIGQDESIWLPIIEQLNFLNPIKEHSSYVTFIKLKESQNKEIDYLNHHHQSTYGYIRLNKATTIDKFIKNHHEIDKI